MANQGNFELDMFDVMANIPDMDELVVRRFEEAFRDADERCKARVMVAIEQLMEQITKNLMKFGRTSVFDDDLMAMDLCGEEPLQRQDEEAVAFRRGALRDLIATSLKKHGYEVARRRDGRPRIVVSLV